MCESILRSIPEWFGIEESLLTYARDTESLPTWIAESPSAGEIGFISVKQHFPESAEVYVIAVTRPYHRRGVGRALVQTAERWARERGCSMLFVKTMGPSKPNAEYAATLRFYRALGFAPLEEFHKEWGGIPCLILSKALGELSR